MTAEAPQRLPYNGKMLRWARRWRGRTVEEAAHRIGVPDERLRAWEDPESNDYPTVRQARALAEFYERLFLEFFYDEPPAIKQSRLIPDFRVHRGAPDPHQDREILAVQQWAEAQRLNALDLYDDLEEAAPEFPSDLLAKVSDDVETVAVAARQALSITIEQQKRLTTEQLRSFPSTLRTAIERLGVLVLRKNELADYGVSGLCIVAFPMPIIVFSAEAPSRQAFTLMHEFAHIILRQSAISGPDVVRNAASYDKKVEKWCNSFAAAFLVPKLALEELRGPRPQHPAANIDETTLATLARVFRVSTHAMLLRLVDLGYVEQDYYWSVMLPLFRAQEAAWKRGGRSKYWASRIVNSLGNLYTGLVLEAWGTNRIPFHQAADYFGLKNPSHLNMIRQEFRGA